MKAIAVYCGSSLGNSEEYKRGAIKLGEELAKRKIKLIYGGSSVGLMGVIADTVLENGGEVIGVIPTVLSDKEIAHQKLTQLYTVNSMHERKAKMADLADGFIAMPGGAGTLEELFEIITWAQIGIHSKPIGLLNIHNYYAPLSTLLDHMVTEGFIKAHFRSLTILESDPGTLLNSFS
ncbi:TIGR00730 family Rossman fold protein [Gracilibacillus oryzae]|uniref:Cytokinin riboside 5'-monophosphate phosphoribohydrolase n=1 Tax=Gracilibacillus oryzae TaxID=1672701 RepID=A0A7C8GVK6_9BACI|nr:TIGR00730 family Rossman fold protein [Gracilibacillus oryzae]KAB8139005.1 TIGR00730 family Rossman fold protein [Gracilibacillus oryzae]